MAIYKGEVVTTTDDDFPFAAIISDQDGNVVGEYPVRTRADGEAKIVEVLDGLKKLADDESNAPRT